MMKQSLIMIATLVLVLATISYAVPYSGLGEHRVIPMMGYGINQDYYDCEKSDIIGPYGKLGMIGSYDKYGKYGVVID